MEAGSEQGPGDYSALAEASSSTRRLSNPGEPMETIATPPPFCYDRPEAGIAQLVERNLAKVEVASSSLVSRSTSA